MSARIILTNDAIGLLCAREEIMEKLVGENLEEFR